MCGRFALGLDADDVAASLGAQYFPHHNSEEPSDVEDEEEGHHSPRGRDGSEGEEEEPPVASRSGSRVAPSAGSAGASGSGSTSGRVHWDKSSKESYRSRYNVAPQSRSVVVRRSKTPEPTIELMKWGLIPSWTKRPPTKPLNTINCRSDRLFEGGGMWGSVRGRNRCVIVAQGFFEWLNKGKDKIPHFTKLPDGKLMILAGLFDSVKYQDSEEQLNTFTIITTDVNKQLSFLHDRMPAILTSPNEISLWLSDQPWNPEVQALIRPFEGKLECYKVPNEVGKVQNDSPDFIKPVAERKGNIQAMFAAQASSPSKRTIGSKLKKEIPPPQTTKPLSSSSIKKRDRSSSIEFVVPPEKKAPADTTAGETGDTKVGKKKKRLNYEKKDSVKTDKKGNGLVTSFFQKDE
ncbi:hypothetical protein P7C70_g146, partial [Phenoliferia sp. Uapishka_3]